MHFQHTGWLLCAATLRGSNAPRSSEPVATLTVAAAADLTDVFGEVGGRELRDLAGQQFRYIAVAQPALEPYGQATIDALRNARLWEAVQPKVV